MAGKEITKPIQIEDVEYSVQHLTQPMQSLKVAEEVGNLIKEKHLSANIQGKEFVMAEGWQFAGIRFGIIPVCEEPIRLDREGEIAYKCTCNLTNYKTGEIVGKGYGFCSNTEPSKRKFEEYAIASMAQTRAIGKGYRNLLAWIMKASGFEPTPAEEMDEVKSISATTDTKHKTPTNPQQDAPIDIFKEKYGGTGAHKDKVYIDIPVKYFEAVLSTPAYVEKISERKLDAMHRTVDFLKKEGKKSKMKKEEPKAEPTPTPTEEGGFAFDAGGAPSGGNKEEVIHKAVVDYMPPPIMKALEASPCNEMQKNFVKHFLDSELFTDAEKDIISNDMNVWTYNQAINQTGKLITEYKKRWATKYPDTSAQ